MTNGKTIADDVLAQRISWMNSGTDWLLETAEPLVDTDPLIPSALPDWTRAHVLAHLAQNADALINLLTWARTGVPTPMYASPEARQAAIAAAIGQPMPELLAEVRASAARLRVAVNDLPESTWSSLVRTAQGREVTAAEVPWMRVREVWLHALDLGTGAEFASVPTDVAVALLQDIAGTIGTKISSPGFVLVIDDAAIDIPVGAVESTDRAVQGTATDLLAWLSGRDASVDLAVNGERPTLPAWLCG